MLALMTEKMQMLYMDIVASLGQLPREIKECIFGYEGDENFDWVYSVADHIALELIKYSYDYSDPQYSLRHFLKDVTDDNERMLQQRIFTDYVIKYKKMEMEMKGGDNSPGHKYSNIEMNTVSDKLDGYKITEMNWYEQQNIHDLDIIKAIVKRRIVSSKKIDNTRFQEIFDKYDESVESLIDRSKKSDKDMVFASLAFFTLEWHYTIEWFYSLACSMEKEGIDTVDRETLVLLCGYLCIESLFGGLVTAESRMIKARMMLSPYLFGKEIDDADREMLIVMFKETLVVVARYVESVKTHEGQLYKEWFREESSMEDWASFFRYYNVFDIWKKKEWTPKRIRKMRYLFDMALMKS